MTSKDYFDNSLLKSISLYDDEKAYRKLFEEYYSPLCVFAKRYIYEKEIREDIVEDVFTVLWEKRKDLYIESSLKNYLMTSVKNLCLNSIRKSNNKLEYNDSLLNNEDSFVENTDELYTLNELHEMLNNALSKLPEEYRLAFEMSFDKNLSVPEIANKLGISVRTLERYRNKATELLKNDLKEYLPLIISIYVKFN